MLELTTCHGAQNQSEYSFVKLKEIRDRCKNQLECFWNTGVVTADWTTVPETEHMRDIDICHECKGVASTVYIDGSSYKFGNSSYSGWGIWSLDNPILKENGPLKGKSQSSDRAEVRALLAALEKSESVMDIITDNQYVRDTAQYLQSGGRVHKGKHFDLWNRIKQQIHKINNIRWVKAHLRK